MSLGLMRRGLTPEQFVPIYNSLCVACQARQDETGVTQGVYYRALSDLSLESLQASSEAIARNGVVRDGQRKTYFPTTAEWREVAQTHERERLREAVKPARDEPWVDECGACNDTGWEYFRCDGTDICGRRKKHAAHDYVRPCTCRPTNRTYARRQQFGGD